MSHEVLNQAPPLVDYNLFSSDRALRSAVAREGAGWACAALEQFGQKMGSAEVIEWGALANENPPVLRTHDRYGNRRDEVEFHPAWHSVMRRVDSGRRPQSCRGRHARPGAHVARAAMAMLASENEAGHVCPLSMTYSAVPVLRREFSAGGGMGAADSFERLRSAFRPAAENRGALIGMAMTEKQGGSDVRANTTRAESDRAAAST